jgi:hypothetical protein
MRPNRILPLGGCFGPEDPKRGARDEMSRPVEPTFPRWTAHPPTLGSIVKESIEGCEVVHTWKSLSKDRAQAVQIKSGSRFC